MHRNYDQKKVIVDAGAIALSKDRGPLHLDEACGYGRVLDLDGNDTGLRVASMSQEHGTIRVEENSPIGTRFIVELPVSTEGVSATAEHAQHTDR